MASHVSWKVKSTELITYNHCNDGSYENILGIGKYIGDMSHELKIACEPQLMTINYKHGNHQYCSQGPQVQSKKRKWNMCNQIKIKKKNYDIFLGPDEIKI